MLGDSFFVQILSVAVDNHQIACTFLHTENVIVI